MTEFIPTSEAVEAAGNAIKNQWLSEGTHWLPNDCARAAIAAFVEAGGLEALADHLVFRAEAAEARVAKLEDARDTQRDLHREATELLGREVERLHQATEALREIAGDYGCSLRTPADPSEPPTGESCRARLLEREDWCYPCLASVALAALAGDRGVHAPTGDQDD